LPACVFVTLNPGDAVSLQRPSVHREANASWLHLALMAQLGNGERKSNERPSRGPAGARLDRLVAEAIRFEFCAAAFGAGALQE
jgi:hypothetical protein